MAFNFPTSPSPGQTYLGPNNVEYTWDGVTWIGTSEAGGVIEAGSANQVLYKNSSNILTGSDELVFNSGGSLGLGRAPGSYAEISKFTIDGTGKSSGIFINFNGTGEDKQIVLNNGAGPVGFIGTNNTALTIGTGATERLHITSDGNVGIATTGAASARLDVRASAAGKSLYLGDNVNSSLYIEHLTDGGLDTVYAAGTTPRWRIRGNLAMGLHQATGSLHLTNDLILTAVPGQGASPRLAEIVWGGHEYPEKHRIWPSDAGLAYQKDAAIAGVAGLFLHTGNFTTTYVNWQSTSLFTNPGFTDAPNGVGQWDDSQNFIDVYPPAGYTMAHLQSCIASIGAIWFNGNVNLDDALRARSDVRADRIRVFVQNTEQREAPRVNFLAIWRR